MNVLKLALKCLFRVADTVDTFSIGKMGADRFAPVLKDGKETNCRIYLWNKEEVKRLQDIADKLHRKIKI